VHTHGVAIDITCESRECCPIDIGRVRIRYTGLALLDRYGFGLSGADVRGSRVNDYLANAGLSERHRQTCRRVDVAAQRSAIITKSTSQPRPS